MFYNMDCIEGARQHLEDNSIDLIITDPPMALMEINYTDITTVMSLMS